MPIYEYQCTACGHQLEALQKISEEPLKECPKCQQPTLNKMVSAAGFQLKGSGWYITDYRDKNKPKPSEGGGSSDSSGTSSETKSTDSKSGGSNSSNNSAVS